MKLFIHAGCHKTATTFFQRLCTQNRNDLLKEGVVYPAKKKRIQHSWLMHEIQRNGIEVLRVFLKNCIDDAPKSSKAFLLSGEDFENCIVDTQLADRIEEVALEVGFSEVIWIVVTRNVAEYAESVYSEFSKHGVVLDYLQVAAAATNSGVIYCSTSHFNYILALDYQLQREAFEGQGRRVIKYDMDTFTAEYPGFVVLRDVLGISQERLSKKQVADSAPSPVSPVNARLSWWDVELNYCVSFLSLRRGLGRRSYRFVLLMLFLPLILIRNAHKKRIHKRYFGESA